MRPLKCPYCKRVGREIFVQQNSKCWWCLKCGWAKNKYPDPDTGRPIERRPW